MYKKIIEEVKMKGLGMKKIIFCLIILLNITSTKGQNLGEDIKDALTDVKDLALLVSITADIFDNTFSTMEKIRIINKEIKETNILLLNPSYMIYSSNYTRNAILRDIKNYALMTQMYALTLRNLIKMTTMLVEHIISLKGKIIALSFQKVAAQLSTKKANVSILGTKDPTSGDINATTIAQLKDNKYSSSGKSLQSKIVSILLKLDDFNIKIDQLYSTVLFQKSKLNSSVGLGVLLSATSNFGSSGAQNRVYLERRKEILRNQLVIEKSEKERKKTDYVINNSLNNIKKSIE